MGVSHMTVQRVWRAHRLQRRSWPLSSRRRPGVEAQYVDVVGMYRNAPGRAVAFAVDDFPRADGSSRSRSSVGKGVGLPRGGTRVRARGSLGDLVAALRPFETREVARGRDSDQHRDFLSFLRRIDVEAPEALQVHLVLDDRRAHTTNEVERWLRHHPRFVLHFVPAGASLSAVASAWLSEREPATPGLDHLESAGALRRAVLALGRRGYGRAEPWVWTRGSRRARPAVSRTRRRLGPAGMLPPDLRLG
jgi:hypothetical protein